MKKIIVLIVTLIIISAVAVVSVKLLKPEKPIVKGEIMTTEAKKTYNEISQHAYKGVINFRDYYIVFRPTSYKSDVGSQYECVTFQKVDDYYMFDTYYDVFIDGENLTFKYTSGADEIYLEGTYDGTLTINNAVMEKVDLSEVPQTVYGIGKENLVTNDQGIAP